MIDLGGFQHPPFMRCKRINNHLRSQKYKSFPLHLLFKKQTGEGKVLGGCTMYMYQLHQVIILPISRVRAGKEMAVGR